MGVSDDGARPERNSVAGEPIRRPVRSVLWRVRDRLFALDEQRLSAPGRVALTAARVAWIAVRALFRDRLHLRAASLSFHSVLALVPAVALAFALGKATGLYEWLRDGTIEPFLDETLGPIGHAPSPGVAGLRSTAESLLSLVDDTSLTGLGVGGLVVLVVALARVLRGAEEAFASVYEQRGVGRPIHTRVRAFLITALVTPLGLLYSVTAASASHGAVAELVAQWVPFELLRSLLFVVLPLLFAGLSIFVMYVELVDAEIDYRAAAVGAGFAALAWYALQLAHVDFQVGLARWNAIYSGFGAFPVLLADIQASWLVVLAGAQVAATLQNAPSLRALAKGPRRDHATLQAIGMRAVVVLAELDHPASAHDVALAADADVPSTRAVLEALVAHRLAQSIVVRGRKQYALSVDPASVKAFDVVDVVDRSADDGELPWREDALVGPLLSARKSAADSSLENITVAELVRRKGPRAPDATP